MSAEYHLLLRHLPLRSPPLLFPLRQVSTLQENRLDNPQSILLTNHHCIQREFRQTCQLGYRQVSQLVNPHGCLLVSLHRCLRENRLDNLLLNLQNILLVHLYRCLRENLLDTLPVDL